jgi:hypothetical protein
MKELSFSHVDECPSFIVGHGKDDSSFRSERMKEMEKDNDFEQEKLAEIEAKPPLQLEGKKTLDKIGHDLAKKYVYPAVFGPKIARIENVGNANYGQSIEKKIKKVTLDHHLGIDTVVTVKTDFEGHHVTADYTVQERTVRNYYGNICIRVLNDRGNPSEFFNFGATHYLFMVVENEVLERWIWVPHATRMISKVLDGTLKYDLIKSKDSFSEFIVISVSDLETAFPNEIIQISPPQKPLN